MTRILTCTAAIGLLAASGVMHEYATRSLRGGAKITMAASRLERVPLDMGDWQGQPEQVEQDELVGIGIDASLARRYMNRRSGRSVTILLMCGQPGPVSVHTPDICYLDAGFTMAQSRPRRVAIASQGPARQATFFSADFAKQGTIGSERLRVYWSWSDGKGWVASDSPRIAFAAAPRLYKVYLMADGTAGQDDSAEAFASVLLPRLDQALFSNPPG